MKELRSYLHICFNAPYTPQLNPIEEMFALWKHYYRPLKIANENDVISKINIASNKINKGDLIGFINYFVKYYFQCLENKDIY